MFKTSVQQIPTLCGDFFSCKLLCVKCYRRENHQHVSITLLQQLTPCFRTWGLNSGTTQKSLFTMLTAVPAPHHLIQPYRTDELDPACLLQNKFETVLNCGSPEQDQNLVLAKILVLLKNVTCPIVEVGKVQELWYSPICALCEQQAELIYCNLILV